MGSGFTLLGEVDVEARQGGVVRCNDWRLDLFSDGRAYPMADRCLHFSGLWRLSYGTPFAGPPAMERC
jgi:hypothetical protein